MIILSVVGARAAFFDQSDYILGSKDNIKDTSEKSQAGEGERLSREAVGINLEETEPEPSITDMQANPLLSADEILKLVNAERARVEAPPLAVEDKLVQSAQWKADDMAIYNYFSHSAKDKSTGNNGLDYLISLGASCTTVAENLNKISGPSQYITSELTFNSWRESRPHYASMINPRFTTTGIGISGSNPSYQVQHFCG